MDAVKIIFFDIDGTLIDIYKKQMTEKVRETLLALKERGIILALATGRSPITIPHFEGITFDVFLTFNGSYCYTPEKTIFERSIPAEDINKLIANAERLNRPVSVATKDKIVANGKDKDLVDYFSLAKLEVTVADDFDEVIKENVYQMMLGCTKEEYSSLLKDVDGAKITAWWDRAVDVIPSAGGKGIGVEKVLEYYHIDKENALAFGDGSNDLEMLQTVGCGIAMGNASDEVKKAADEVCLSSAEDGIYWYCKEHNLI